MRSLKYVDPLLIEYDFLHNLQPFTTSSMSLNSRSVSEFLLKLLNSKKSWWNQTSLMWNILSTVLNQKESGTQRKVVKMYKIQWDHHTEEEVIWETKIYLNQKISSVFLNLPKVHALFALHDYPNLRTRFFLRGIGCDNLGI